MSPAALLDYDRSRLRGVVLEEGGASNHIAIVARALSIPAVSDIANFSEIVEQGDPIIVDGDTGEVYLRPPADVEASFAEKARMRARRAGAISGAARRADRQRRRLGRRPAYERRAASTCRHLAEAGAKSIGLFRTELQFMLAARFPRPQAQERIYRAILDAAGDRPVTFRTLDIGGDKLLPYMKGFEEENPALGWRAIRIGLDRPALLRMQFRALFARTAGRDLRIMVPMVSTVEEYKNARLLFERELCWSKSQGFEPPRSAAIGVMVEVPSLLWQIDEIWRRADFLSVGSNDLMQYMFAVDRTNRRVSSRFDPLSVGCPAGAAGDSGSLARWRGTPVTLCGEIGGRPLEAMALMAIGYRHLSMSAASIGPVKAMTLTLNIGEAARAVEAMLTEGRDDASLRKPMIALAERLKVRL